MAQAIWRTSGVEKDACLLEIGAGTGEIGVCLAQGCAEYVGIDQSNAMLEQFRLRLGEQPAAQLICSDANQRWPVKDGWAHIVFGSRVFHLLNASEVTKEVARVAHPAGATFLLGRVVRDENSVKSQMRSKMRKLMVDCGLTPRKSNRTRNDLLGQLNQLGTMLEPTVAASWDSAARPNDSIRSWDGKDNMGGIIPPPADKRKVLEELSRWAIRQFGDPEAEIVTEEQYILEGVRLAIR